MRSLITLLLIASIGCQSPTKPVSRTNQFHIEQDTVIVSIIEPDTLAYSRAEFNTIIDSFPTLLSKHPENPDLTFHCSDQFKKITDEQTIRFTSESGQDNYFLLYAYFLRKQFNLDKYQQERETLTSIFRGINSIYSQLNFGGTYFGHQYKRIAGYAEYSVYLQAQSTLGKEIVQDIRKQKELYVAHLKQMVKDELSTDHFNAGVINADSKKEMENELYEKINELGKLLTSSFYLKQAYQFQYAHY